ncbi:MAG TPA: alpha-L-arabinofuranosidase C-terminal domain-containing protein [Pyrinomonadaceae bacterium]|nr:alpha-L-arabinofuranosidase C-terminal domain-containing protein [Pyrinomonadaceae bacterium]
MKPISRRTFVGSMMATGAAALLAPRSTKAAESRIEILVNEPIGQISPDLYSHFVEHLGGVVYDGIWVGEKSKIPNYNGIRKDLVDNLKKLKPGVIRYPGGCFADQYDWRDGVGPRDQRPTRVNFWADTHYKTTKAYEELEGGPQKYESNHFGTDEFVSLCRMVGAQPYLAANMRSRDVRVFLEWLEYCNAPANLTTWSTERAKNGYPQPHNVQFWGIGNESWGCGGDFTPEEYATEFRKFTAWLPTYGLQLKLIGSGPNGGDLNWTRKAFEGLALKGSRQIAKLYGWGLHYYCGSTGQQVANEFTENEWYDLLERANRMESLIESHWQVMGEYDRERRVKLAVDEWGAWHKQDPDVPPAYLYAYAGTLRDALVSALNLDTFQRHADKVAMANPAQLVNTIHSMFYTYEDKFTVTSNYHVFEMYGAHAGATAVRTDFVAPKANFTRLDAQRKETPASLWGLNGSASVKDKQLVLTVVNPHARDARETEIAIRGGAIKSGKTRTLTSTDLHARNTFANPHGLEPKDGVVSGSGSTITFTFAPASVTRLVLDLS